MRFSLVPLLLAEPDLPPRALAALRLAVAAPPVDRTRLLEHAARVLACDADLDVADARELVGLPAMHGKPDIPLSPEWGIVHA